MGTTLPFVDRRLSPLREDGDHDWRGWSGFLAVILLGNVREEATSLIHGRKPWHTLVLCCFPIHGILVLRSDFLLLRIRLFYLIFIANLISWRWFAL